MERRGRGRGLSGVPTLGAVGDAPSSSTSKRMGLRWSTMNICVAIGTLALVVVAIFNTGIVAVGTASRARFQTIIFDANRQYTVKKGEGGAGSRPVLASFVTGSMKEFLFNWAKSAESVGVLQDVQVAAFDQGAVDACKEFGLGFVPIFEANGSSTTEFSGVATGGMTLDGKKIFAEDTGAFMQIGVQKAVYLHRLLETKPVLMSDVDVAFINDPFPYLEEILSTVEFDLAVTNDCLSLESDYRANEEGCTGAEFNTGVLLWRPTERARKFVEEWRDAMVNPVSKWEHDQGAFNRIIKKNGLRRIGNRLVEATTAEGPLRVFILPMDQFAGGHVYFVQRYPQLHNKTAFMVHTTYQFSHSFGKRERLREEGLWLTDDDAYYSGGNFLKVSSFLPDELRDGQTVETHLSLSMHYRKTLRAAFAIGEVLNRTVIMPELKCACDRWWGNILPSCIIPGAESSMSLPFTCPMDHLFFLTGLEWREYSFLENDRIPEDISRSVVRVGVEGMEEVMDPSVKFDLLLNKMANDEEVLNELGGLSDVRVLELHAGAHAFCGFKDGGANDKFNTKIEKALTASCHYCLSTPKDDTPKYKWVNGRDCAVGFDLPPRPSCPA